VSVCNHVPNTKRLGLGSVVFKAAGLFQIEKTQLVDQRRNSDACCLRCVAMLISSGNIIMPSQQADLTVSATQNKASVQNAASAQFIGTGETRH
jgi:hypothetical protein